MSPRLNVVLVSLLLATPVVIFWLWSCQQEWQYCVLMNVGVTQEGTTSTVQVHHLKKSIYFL